MNSEIFIDAVKKHVRDAAVSDTLELLQKPPGRRPAKNLVDLSQWFNSLNEKDKQEVGKVAREAVDIALFGLFCVLDGVRIVEEKPVGEEPGQFKLFFRKENKEVELTTERGMFLHDLFNAE